MILKLTNGKRSIGYVNRRRILKNEIKITYGQPVVEPVLDVRKGHCILRLWEKYQIEIIEHQLQNFSLEFRIFYLTMLLSLCWFAFCYII